MRERDAFGMVLQTLRERLRDGRYAPGAPLVIAELSQELRISPTPLREALARLAGEALIEDRRGWGFCAWRSGREAYEELYRLHLLYVELALSAGDRVATGLDGRDVAALADPIAPGGLRAATEAVFGAVVEGGCQLTAIQAFRTVVDRLAPLRLAEARLFDDAAEELRRLAAALAFQGEAEGQDKLRQYHARRIDAVGKLAVLASALPSQNTPDIA